ncbi:hypothetical protein GE21DRAFT_1305701 [Neurospora crassa]|nr:hypothetical protein GE21DRAFT_1305701 [Neurospora crassa]
MKTESEYQARVAIAHLPNLISHISSRVDWLTGSRLGRDQPRSITDVVRKIALLASVNVVGTDTDDKRRTMDRTQSSSGGFDDLYVQVQHGDIRYSKYYMRHQPAAAGPGTKSMKLYRIVSDLIVMPHGSPQPMELDAPGGGVWYPLVPFVAQVSQVGLCKNWAGLEQDTWPLSARPVATQGRTTTNSCLAVLQLPSCLCACEVGDPFESKFGAGWLVLFRGVDYKIRSSSAC